MIFLTVFSILLTLFIATTDVISAPRLDGAALRRNGEEAQQLNALFQTLNEFDTCVDGSRACVSGNAGRCENSKWLISSCSSKKTCFALPAFTIKGTILECTTEETAFSLIDSTGAIGGIFGSDSNLESGQNGSSSTGETSTLTNTSISRPTAIGPVTVTVTISGVTTQATRITTTTRTLSAQAAFGVISDSLANGGTVIGELPCVLVGALTNKDLAFSVKSRDTRNVFNGLPSYAQVLSSLSS